MADGIRTRDRRHHKPELYQLSYCHRAGLNLPGLGGGWGRAGQARASSSGFSVGLASVPPRENSISSSSGPFFRRRMSWA